MCYEQISFSGLRFRRIQHITTQSALTTKPWGVSYIKTPYIIANKKGATVNIKIQVMIFVLYGVY